MLNDEEQRLVRRLTHKRRQVSTAGFRDADLLRDQMPPSASGPAATRRASETVEGLLGV